jgi:hypothetical protein
LKCKRPEKTNGTVLAFKTWSGIKRRVSPKCKDAGRYYRRGIRMCARWQKFENFLADMGERPSVNHSIDRYPDNDGDYKPGNCRWATAKQQARHRRSNRKITFRGQTKTVTEWAEEMGVSRAALGYRLNAGWSIRSALRLLLNHGNGWVRRVRPNRLIRYAGRSMTVTGWSRATGIKWQTLRHRLDLGWSPKEIVTTVVGGQR